MKYAITLAAAVLPFAALAQGMQTGNWNPQDVQGDWRVSEMIGSDVESNDGQEVGELKDVVIGADGKIVSVLVEATDEFLQRQGGGAQQMGAENAGFDQESGMAQTGTTGTGGTGETGTVATTEEDRRETQGGGGEMSLGGGGGQLVALEWNNPSFMAEEGIVRVDTGSGANQQLVAYEDEQQAVQQGSEHLASEVLGMDVNLADQEGYAQIDDILVSQDGNASAFLLEAGGFFSSETYAVPAQFENVNTEEDTINFQMTSQEVEGSGEFNLEQYTEST